jgi:hypothetical protein
MRPVRFALAFCSFVLAATFPPVVGAARESSIRTDDLVVFGRVKGLDYESLDEFSMNAQITARLTITRVIRGRPPSPVLTIKYIAHTDYAKDRIFRFHLRRSQEVWLACSDGQGRGYVCR